MRLARIAAVALLCWIGATVGANSADRQPSAAPLARIRVSTDGRSLVQGKRRPFVPFGVTYYRPGTGWAPQVWRKFDPEATRQDFARMKELGINCVRVFLSYGSFYQERGVLAPEGLAKFDQLLAIAEAAGIYVHPTGPDHWEGPPQWHPVAVAEPITVAAAEEFWRLFAARYRGRAVIFAYDLQNEPQVGWDKQRMLAPWNAWLQRRYSSAAQLQSAWDPATPLQWGQVAVPDPTNSLGSRRLLDFQSFREDLADEWTRRQAAAIKAADPQALVTVGFLQTSVPSRVWSRVSDYAAFRPQRQARYLDFLEIHFYPLEHGAFEYRSEQEENANLAYLEGVVREVARAGKPVVLAEFGWYGGAQKPKFDRGTHPAASEEQQARYLRRVVEVSKGFASGWLNWGLYDQPEATDCSEQTGLLTADGRMKAWGQAFQQLARGLSGQRLRSPKIGPRPTLDWDACLTTTAASDTFRAAYLPLFLADHRFQ